MTYIFIAGHCDDLPVAVCCRVMKVSTSGFYAWQAHPVAERDLDDAILTNHIFDRGCPEFRRISVTVRWLFRPRLDRNRWV